jgi:hypothetical protein
MDRFEEAWNEGLKQAERRLRAKSPAASLLTRRLQGVCFPAALSLFAEPKKLGQEKGGSVIAAAAKKAATEKALARSGLDAEAIEDVLAALLVERRRPSDVLRDPKVAVPLVRAALASQGIETSPAEARDVVALLESGEFFGDLADVTGAVFRVFPRLPRAILKDVPTVPVRSVGLLGALLADVHDMLGGLRMIAEDVAADGRLDASPRVLNRTLTKLYGVATVATTRDLVRQLIQPKNRAVRLAIILYARANGVPLTEKHLDVLYERVLSPDDPDLGPALAVATETLAARYAPAEIEEVLRAMRRHRA